MEKTLGDLAKEWESQNPGSVYDTAIPLHWSDAVFSKTGEWPFGFVWGYLKHSIFGAPIPLTAEAKTLFSKLSEPLQAGCCSKDW
jgi:hypothetical protein